MSRKMQACRRCGKTFELEILFTMMERLGASVSGERGKCWNPETEQLEEHDWWADEEENS